MLIQVVICSSSPQAPSVRTLHLQCDMPSCLKPTDNNGLNEIKKGIGTCATLSDLVAYHLLADLSPLNASGGLCIPHCEHPRTINQFRHYMNPAIKKAKAVARPRNSDYLPNIFRSQDPLRDCIRNYLGVLMERKCSRTAHDSKLSDQSLVEGTHHVFTACGTLGFFDG